MAKHYQQAREIQAKDGSYAGEDHLEKMNLQKRIQLVAEPEESAYAPRHYKKYDQGKLDKELKPAGINVTQIV